MCVHDRRLERTSDGRGVLSTKRLEELAALDWDTRRSAWADLDDEVELPDRNAGKILTLHDLLAMVHDWHRPVQVAIETKHPVRYSGRVEQRLVQTLASFGWAQHGWSTTWPTSTCAPSSGWRHSSPTAPEPCGHISSGRPDARIGRFAWSWAGSLITVPYVDAS